MIHLGDITKISGYDAPVVDVVIGGSPCQDLSVAGKRAGLAGERSGLYMEQIRIIKEMRQADVLRGRANVDIRPRYMVWENVPGAFSSNGGKDFAAVIEEAIRVSEPEAPDVPVPEKGWPTSGILFDEFGRWSVAWRVLDAQFWGVPQRRRRIALVADFGGRSAGEILFEPKGVRGYYAEGRTPQQTTAGDAENCVGADDCEGKVRDVIPINMMVATRHKRLGRGTGFGVAEIGAPQFTISAGHEHAVAYSVDSLASNSMKSSNPNSGCRAVEVAKTLDTSNPNPSKNQGWIGIVEPVGLIDSIGGQAERGWEGDVSPTLKASHYKMPPCVAIHAAGFCTEASSQPRENGDSGTVSTLTGDHENRVTDYSSVVVYKSHPQDSRVKETGEVSPTVSVKWHKGAADTPLVCECQPIPIHDQATRYSGKRGDKCDGKGNGLGVGKPGDSMNTLTAGDRHAVAYCTDVGFVNSLEEVAPTLLARSYKDPHLVGYPETAIRYIVRRLTPLECERLQGLPDGWTDIGEWVDSKGKKHKDADSPRYKALGNSIAIPPWKWVLKRICACYERDATMASLFDGIGGFPYIWEQLNGKGSCLWASEIEEFPMAVTKLRFGG